MCLFDGINGVPFGLEGLNSVQCLFVVLPLDGLLRTESRLVYLLVRRTTTDSAEHDALNTHRIGGAEDGPDIMLATHVIENHDERYLLCLAVLVHVQAVHFG